MPLHPFRATTASARRIGAVRRTAIQRAVQTGALPDDWAEREFRLLVWREQQVASEPLPRDLYQTIARDGVLHAVLPEGGDYRQPFTQEDRVSRAAYRQWCKEDRERDALRRELDDIRRTAERYLRESAVRS